MKEIIKINDFESKKHMWNKPLHKWGMYGIQKEVNS